MTLRAKDGEHTELGERAERPESRPKRVSVKAEEAETGFNLMSEPKTKSEPEQLSESGLTSRPSEASESR